MIAKKINNSHIVKYIRENWKEWFVVIVEFGYERPRFYLPIRRLVDRAAIEYWIFYLVPFVFFVQIASKMVHRLCVDLIEWNELLQEK